MFLFDTDILSNILKKNPSPTLLRRIAIIPSDQQFTSTITVGEMIYGAYKSGRPSYFLEKLDKLVLPNVNILSFDEASAYTYGKLRAEIEKKGTPLTEPDLRIASIAITYNLTIVSGNVRHFFKIPGVKVENWIEE